MLIHFPESLRARRFEKSANVCPVVQNGSRSPQGCGAGDVSGLVRTGNLDRGWVFFAAFCGIFRTPSAWT